MILFSYANVSDDALFSKSYKLEDRYQVLPSVESKWMDAFRISSLPSLLVRNCSAAINIHISFKGNANINQQLLLYLFTGSIDSNPYIAKHTDYLLL